MQLSKYVIEDLQKEDVEWAVEEAATRMLIEELKRPNLVNHTRLYNLTIKTIEQRTVLVAKVDGKPAGIIAGLIIPNLYNPEITECVEMFWYVLPEYRSSRVGLLLLNKFIERGEELADNVTISLLKGSPVNFKTLEKRGFVNTEYGFIKERNK